MPKKGNEQKSVFQTQRVHLFPFRTQKLSFAVATILAWRRAGKIVHRQHSLKWDIWLFRISHFHFPSHRREDLAGKRTFGGRKNLRIQKEIPASLRSDATGATPSRLPMLTESLGATPNLPPDAHPSRVSRQTCLLMLISELRSHIRSFHSLICLLSSVGRAPDC